MKYRCDVNVEIDLMEVFSDMNSSDQKRFVREYLEALEDEELIDELEKRGYDVLKHNE